MPTTLSRKEAAERLGVTAPTIDQLERDGSLKRLPRFTSPRFSLADIEMLERGSESNLVRKLNQENEYLRKEVTRLQAIVETVRRVTE